MFKYKTDRTRTKAALQKSYDKLNFAYFMEMGCGKSKVLLDNSHGYMKTDTLNGSYRCTEGRYRNWEMSEYRLIYEDIDTQIYVWVRTRTKST